VLRLFLKDWMECRLQIKQYVICIWNHTCSFLFALCCCFLQSELFFVLVEFVGQVVCARYSDEEYFKERCQGRICVFVRFQLFSTGSVIIVNVYVLSASLSLRLLIRFCSRSYSSFEGNDNLFFSSSNSFYLYSLCFNNCPKRHIMLDMFESCSNKFMITNKSFMLNIILTFFWKIKKVHLSCFQGNEVLVAYF